MRFSRHFSKSSNLLQTTAAFQVPSPLMIAIVGLFLISNFFVPPWAFAERRALSGTSNPAELPVCTGWLPDREQFGLVGTRSFTVAEEYCPNNYALMSVLYSGNARRPGAQVSAIGTCCPLPTGALLEESYFAPEECRDGFVATGSRQSLVPPKYERSLSAEEQIQIWHNDRQIEIRCTRVDSSKYRLAPITQGIWVGWSKSFRTYFDRRVLPEQIPISLRYGFGRYSKHSWNTDFCVGAPWGSLFVGKTSKYCDGMLFRQLVPTNSVNSASPPPELDYESCLHISDAFEPNAKCLAIKSPDLLKQGALQ